MQQQPTEQKGDIRGLLRTCGIMWDPNYAVWDSYNPLFRTQEQPQEIVFVSPKSGMKEALSTENQITKGMERLVFILGGAVREAVGTGYDFTPLARTSTKSGLTSWTELMPYMRGGMPPAHELEDEADRESYVMAASVSGVGSLALPEGPQTGSVNCIVIADTDVISDVFFMLRRQGNREYRFDNVSFVLNCVDKLAGDEDLIALRNHRPAYRTLELVEKEKAAYDEERLQAEEEARERAQTEINKAKERVEERIEALNETKSDFAGQLTGLMLIQETENRKLEEQTARIEERKDKEIARIKAQSQRKIRRFENKVRIWSLILPPLPAIIIGLLVLAWQIRRESAGTPLTRSMRQV
jgi:ABC-2 type transport system permease protein